MPPTSIRRPYRALAQVDRAAASNQAGAPFSLAGASSLSLWLEVVTVASGGKVDVKLQGALESDAASSRWADIAAFEQKSAVGFFALTVAEPLPPWARIVWTVTTANVEFVVDALIKGI